MSSIALWPTVIVVAVATMTDLRSRMIPNWLVLPFLLLGVGISTTMRGWNGFEQSLLGILAAALVLGIFCYLGGMGMGDLKLCAAIGAWIGPSQLFVALVMTALVGGVMAICWAVAGGFLIQTLRGVGHLLAGFGRRGLRPHSTMLLDNPLARKMPYAPAIAIGTIFSFLAKH